MLSVTGVKAGQAANYYSKDDYYFREQKAAELITGEAVVGSSYLTYDKMKEIVEQRIKDVKGEDAQLTNDDRIAEDLTFSAPKSVSILAALSTPEVREKIINAHRDAVAEAIKYIVEAGMIQTRDADGNRVAVS